MRTPDASNIISRASPRSLKHNSKRKLDLNSLIDQMPDQDFVEISSNKNESEDQKINSKTNDQDTTTTKKRRNSLKQPLTEHQKEMRRKKSFIPVEMQSVSSVLEPTMDSQMSCTTTQDCFENFSMSQVANNNTINETSKAIIEFSLNCKKAPATPSPAQPQIVTTCEENVMNESNNQMDISMAEQDQIIESTTKSTTDDSDPNNKNQTIKFQSKLNPKKQFLLVEVKQNNQTVLEQQKPDITPELPVQTQNEVLEEDAEIKPSQNLANNNQENEIISSSQQLPKNSQIDADSCLTPNRRRSSRLKSKDLTTPSKLEFNEDKPSSLTEEVENLASQIVTSITTKMSQDELLEKMNEEVKNEKIENKKLKINQLKLRKKPSIMKINHKIAVGKIAKKTFKEKQEEIKKTIKYKKLIKKLKTNKKIDNKKEAVQQITIPEPVVKEEVCATVAAEETKKIENLCTTRIEEESEDEIPLKDLIKNNKLKEEIKSDLIHIQNQAINTSTATTTTTNNNVSEAALISTPTPKSSSNSSNSAFKEIAAVSSEATAVLIQKLNNTPTTSILKKRELQNKQSKSFNSASKNINLSASFAIASTQEQESNLTPNKRRVSFCESVQIEEIEPNANKSMFRTTPKMPNRAKLVLFNNNNSSNSMLNRQFSSPLASSATNSLLNSVSQTTTTTSTSSSSSSSTTTTITTTNNNTNITNTESKLNTSLNLSCLSPTVQNSKVNILNILRLRRSSFLDDRSIIFKK
jgi:trimeric autotransporter adhesin